MLIKKENSHLLFCKLRDISNIQTLDTVLVIQNDGHHVKHTLQEFKVYISSHLDAKDTISYMYNASKVLLINKRQYYYTTDGKMNSFV